jgi:hypothetical protein
VDFTAFETAVRGGEVAQLVREKTRARANAEGRA